MPQLQLPIFYEGVNPITNDVGYDKRDGNVVYYCGSMPVFSHHEKDLASFRLITSQLFVNGNASQAQIVRAFGISSIALKRWVKKYREGGPGAFFQPRNTRSSATVLTPQVLEKVQNRLDLGHTVSGIARELDIPYDTIRKAVSDGRLSKPLHKEKDDPKKTTAKTQAPTPEV